MQNSSRSGRFLILIFCLALMAGGIWWGSIYVRSWLFGVFHGEQIFYFFFALCLVVIGGIKTVDYIHSFFEKPVTIRGQVIRKLVKIQKTTDEDTGKVSRDIVGHSIELITGIGETNKFDLEEEVFDWLNIGDAVKLTYYRSIEVVAKVTKVASPEVRRRIMGKYRAEGR